MIIGKGSYGTVTSSKKDIYAYKTGINESIVREALIYSYLGSHPHIAAYHGSDYYKLDRRNKDILRIKLTRYEQTLGEYIYRIMDEPGGARKLLRAFAEIAAGLEHLVRKKIIHTDLSPANILVDHAGRCVIADFGTAQFDIGQPKWSEVSTINIRAPEAINDQYDGSADIYSLGAIMYRSITGASLVRQEHDGIEQMFCEIFGELPEACTELPLGCGAHVWRDVFRGRIIEGVSRIEGDPKAARPPGENAMLMRAAHIVADCMDLDPAARPSPTAVREALNDLIRPGAPCIPVLPALHVMHSDYYDRSTKYIINDVHRLFPRITSDLDEFRLLTNIVTDEWLNVIGSNDDFVVSHSTALAARRLNSILLKSIDDDLTTDDRFGAVYYFASVLFEPCRHFYKFSEKYIRCYNVVGSIMATFDGDIVGFALGYDDDYVVTSTCDKNDLDTIP